jgi:valyl-tRNA synthetase
MAMIRVARWQWHQAETTVRCTWLSTSAIVKRQLHHVARMPASQALGQNDCRVSQLWESKRSAIMSKSYEHVAVERGWNDVWDDHIIKTRNSMCRVGKQQFSMVFPPPNITGVLHIGHALTTAVQDSFVRWHRMRGHDVVFVPGLDHAGIATQSVVERQLWKESKKTRHDLGRAEFLQRVHAWAEECGHRIRGQLKRLGASFDWDMEAYTLDEQRSAAVRDAFIKLYNDGLIYRQQRFVNWCPYLRTAISDVEVDVMQVTGATKIRLPGRQKSVEVGIMHTFAYPLAETPSSASLNNGASHIFVSTTRPETMLADVAVAVHPSDTRYAHLVGRHVRHPFSGLLLPIIADDMLVQPDVGTGAVKITPAHDANDFACAQRHGFLDSSGMMSEAGVVTAPIAGFAGLDRFDARDRVLQQLKESGLYVECTPHAMALALCSRSGDILEPMLMPQWYVNCKELGKHSADVVRADTLGIFPQAFKQEWYRWLDNIQDWCISRQLVWGHSIPAWRITSPSIQGEQWLVGVDEQSIRLQAAARWPEANDVVFTQDADVLDTWFSSGLFPLSVFAGRKRSHYPLALMETGSDILFFWVARMSMLCTHLSGGVVPFQNVFLHPVVRDKTGRKMSKSLGNVIDPLHVMDGISLQDLLSCLSAGNLIPSEEKKATTQIKQEFPTGIAACGADALRLALAMYMRGHGGRGLGTTNTGINLDLTRIHSMRLFCNKLWNATRFVISKLPTPIAGKEVSAADLAGLGNSSFPIHSEQLRLQEKWILSKLCETVNSFNAALTNFDVGLAASIIHEFFLRDFCDVYVEWSKPASEAEQLHLAATRAVLVLVLDTSLRLFHPLMPFITDELFQHLHGWQTREGRPHTLIGCNFPCGDSYVPIANKPSAVLKDFVNCDAEKQMEQLLDLVGECRSLRKLAVNILGNASMADSSIVAVTSSQELLDLIRSNSTVLAQQIKIGRMSTQNQANISGPHLLGSVSNQCSVYLPLPSSDAVSAGVTKELGRLEKKLIKMRGDEHALAQRIDSAAFSKAPLHVQQVEVALWDELKAEIAAIMQTVGQLEGIRSAVTKDGLNLS